VPVTKENRREAEQQQIGLVREHTCSLVVLARYRQVLSDKFISILGSENLINIHYSFLPAFVGAKPHHKAFPRAVKLIGARAHYVTQVLDDGAPSSSRMRSAATAATPPMIWCRKAATSKKSSCHAPFAGTWKTESCSMEIKPWSSHRRCEPG